MRKIITFITFIIFISAIVSTAHAVASAFLRSGGLRVMGDIYCHTNSGCITQATKECLPILDNASEAGNPEWFDCFEKAELAPPLVTSPSPNASTTPAAGTTNTNPSPTPTPTPTPRPTATPTPNPTPTPIPTPTSTPTPRATTTPRPTSTPTLRPTPTPRVSTTPRPTATRPPGPPKARPTPTPTPRPTPQICTPQVTSVTIGNTQGNSASINLQQYGCSATPSSTCSVTALINLTCGTPNPHPITLSFTYTGPAGSGGSGGTPQTCQEKGGSNYCAGKYGNQYYDCGQPNQVIGQTTADGEGCFNENLVNPPPVQPQTCQTKGGSNYCANKYANQYYDCQPGYPGADSEGCFHEYEPPPTCTSNDDYDQFVKCIGCGQALWVCPEDRSKPPIPDADYPWETRCRTTLWCGGGGGGGGGSQCRAGCQYYPGQGCWYPPVPANAYGSCPGGYEFDPQDEQCWQRC